jgi:hypothetical protein
MVLQYLCSTIKRPNLASMGIGEVQAKGIGKNIQKNNMRIFPKS